MLHIFSDNVMVNKSASDLYSYLSSSFENYKSIMPDDVSTFEADATSFVFGLPGLPEIRLISKENIENEKIVLTAASSKLNFDLACLITTIDDKSCSCKFEFEGEFNAMMAMMIKGPLQNFIDKLAAKLGEL